MVHPRLSTDLEIVVVRPTILTASRVDERHDLRQARQLKAVRGENPDFYSDKRFAVIIRKSGIRFRLIHGWLSDAENAQFKG